MIPRYGLACSGGGSKGAWLAGFFKRLFELHPNIIIDTIVGTSTGSLCAAKVAAYLVTRDPQHIIDLVHIYEHVTTADVLEPKCAPAHGIGGEVGSFIAAAITGDDSLYSTAPLVELIDRFMPTAVWHEIIEAGAGHPNSVEVGFCCVSMQTGEVKTFTNITHPYPAVLRDALLASASEPVFTPLVDIEGEQWTDGGVHDYIPITSVFQSQYADRLDRILAVSLAHSEKSNPVGRLESVDKVFLRTVELLLDGVYGADLRTAELYNALLLLKTCIPVSQWRDLTTKDIRDRLRGKRYVKIIKACPRRRINMDGLTFEPKAMRALCRRGFRDADAFLRKTEL